MHHSRVGSCDSPVRNQRTRLLPPAATSTTSTTERPASRPPRELAEETGVTVTADDLRQIGVWDAPERDPRGRYVTVAYVTVVPVDTTITAGDDARTAHWWPLDDLPERLAFDHAAVLRAAVASTL
ncbi:NUDIX domain-containing protein [Streptomyces doebereineriae]|uniref:NUDIX domain-containing protein n=1 Tax=Streptomyces doebereineriae TaxID=3075528 RepID=A0ABU2VJK7_9ACTN|nr:NUDIX domain-containing protein [Streptomyces sp. DSM 41640]MDT0485455.1 NUDIX domain-containing protein [Streptomyces sp. DSM 41640]